LQDTTAFRVAHGQADGLPDCYADLLGSYLLSQSASSLSPTDQERVTQFARALNAQGVYFKRLSLRPSESLAETVTPQLHAGTAAPERFNILENGLKFELSFAEGYSVGLFLDQRDNRRRLLTGHIAAGFPFLEEPATSRKPEVLNVFAYTCGFSVCAAKAGARTTNIDLSKKYLEWGRRNFALNNIDQAEHDFIFGDAFDWLRRLHKNNRMFDVILLDPPTFSRSKQSGPFRVNKDFHRLLQAALPVLRPRGVLFASSNAADWLPEDFLAVIRKALAAAGRSILQEQYFPQPPDFPVCRAEPAYLKTVWLRVQ
jgi:23S rRNA (cytosine1962-C5)-methyltransferase